MVLVDDALISGTTIYRTVQRLTEGGATVSEVLVLCVNQESWSPDLARPTPPYLELDNRATTSLCASIVDAISLFPMPYAVDFPVLRDLRVPGAEESVLGALTGWMATEVSSPLQRDNGVFSITYAPVNSRLAELGHEYGFPFSTEDLVKVRLYGRASHEDPSVLWCQVMPVVVLRPLSVRHVDVIWEALLASASIADQEWISTFTAHKAKMRLVEYLLAARIGRSWVEQLATCSDLSASLNYDTRTESNLFPPHVCDAIRQIAITAKANFGSPRLMSAELAGLDIRPATLLNPPGVNVWATQARLTAPFLAMYREKELKARSLAKNLGPRVFENAEFGETMDRLQSGVSIKDLSALIDPASLEAAHAVSIFLDQAVDRGIAVPLTVVADDIVMRAYRHGEDVVFGEAEQRLIGLVLKALSEGSGRAELPHLWVEKLIVLALRIGLDKKLFNPWLGQLGAPGTIGVRYSLHGAVAAANSPELFDAQTDNTVTKFLEDIGILKRVGRGLYSIGTFPDGGVHPQAEPQLRQIGTLFGHLLKKNDGTKRTLPDGDLTLLASCMTHAEAAAAMAAEMRIFAEWWRREAPRYRAVLRQPEMASELARVLRSSASFIAVNSGQWKYSNFVARAPWKIVERVRESLPDSLYAATWESFWTASRLQSDEVTGDLGDLVHRAGTWCFQANVCMRALEVSLRCADIANANGVEEIIAEIEHFEQKLTEQPATTKPRVPVSSSIDLRQAVKTNEPDLRALRDSTLASLDVVGALAGNLMGEVRAQVTTLGRPQPVRRFANVMHVDIGPSNISRGQLENTARQVVDEMRIRAKKGRSNALIEVIPDGQGEVLHGTWVCASGRYARAWLSRLAAELCSRLGERAAVRATMFVSLSLVFTLVRPDKSSHYVGRSFWDLAKGLLDGEIGRARASEVVTVHHSDETRGDAIDSETQRELKKLRVGTRRVRTVRISTPFSTTVVVSTYPIVHSLNTRRKSSPGDDVKTDVGIITILPEETRAVIDRLKASGTYEEFSGIHTARTYYRGSLPGAEGHQFRVVCTQALEQGNRSVIPAYYHMSREFSAPLVAVIGIGGSIHADAGLCDVVVADQAVYYDARRIEQSRDSIRGRSYTLAPWLKSRLNHFFTVHPDGSPMRLPSAPNSSSNTFKFIMGPIGTGEGVNRFRDSGVREYLRGYNNKTLVLETEAGGAGQAFYEDDLLNDPIVRGLLVVRGVSDHADEHQDERWRRPASENAVHAFAAFLSSVSPTQRHLELAT